MKSLYQTPSLAFFPEVGRLFSLKKPLELFLLRLLMKRFLIFWHTAFISFLFCCTLGAATEPILQKNAPTLSEKKLLAGVYLDEPFVTASKEGYTGFSVDLWKAIAADLGLPYELVLFHNPSDMLAATAQNKIDIAIGNVWITEERLEIVDFSQPYLQGGMQIMVNEKRTASWRRLWNGLRDSGHLKVFTIGIALVLIGTILLTLGERKWNTEFPHDWGNGLSESFYHVMSITMTGKSTHKGLPGPFGKILSGIWLAFGVGVVAYITSSVTSVMTVNRLHGIIDGPQDLPGHPLGAIEGTLSQKYCEDRNLHTTLYTNLPDAVQALLHHDIDAIIYDAMILQWYDNAHPELPITEVGSIFMQKGYGLALPIKSPLRQEINRSLLKQQESGFVETLRKHYFGDIP
jgi:ABC-type amino acid transport substrate-binding protein